MSDRAIVALLPAVSLGFLAGILASTLQLNSQPTLYLFLAGAALVLVASLASVLGLSAATGERTIVAVLRAACAVALFGTVYLALLALLQDGDPLTSILWTVIAAVVGLAASQVSVRERPEPEADADAEPAQADA